MVSRQPASEVVGDSGRPPRCEVSTRAVQCSGRSSQLSGSGYRGQVVSPPAGGERSASSLELATDRSVRYESQREAFPILFPCPRAPGSLQGCVSSSLGQPGPVRVFTLSSGRKGGGSSQRDTQFLHNSGHPPLAGEGVVHRPSSSTDPTTSGIPWWDRLLRQPHFNRFHNGVHELNLHAWRLSSVSSESQAFLKDLPSICPAASEHPLPGCTK